MEELSLTTVGPSGDCAVLRVAGEVDLYSAPALRTAIRGLGAAGTIHLIVDLGQVGFLDSTGLGVLVGGLKRLREDGGSLALVVTTSRILSVFQLTGLTKAFAVWPAVADAIAADAHWRKTVEAEAGSIPDWCRQHGLT